MKFLPHSYANAPIQDFVNSRSNDERRLVDGAQFFKSMKGIRDSGKPLKP